jgi:hypothetical protein
MRHLYGFNNPTAAYTQFENFSIYLTAKEIKAKLTGVDPEYVSMVPASGQYLNVHVPVPSEVKTSEEFFNQTMNSTFPLVSRDTGLLRGNKCVEVILTDSQVLSYPYWVKKLKENNFVLVNRFRNTSLSWCNVFHRVHSRDEDENGNLNVPTWWKEAKA